MYAWFERNRGMADPRVGLDGTPGSVKNGALGIYWSRMKFTGPGAHTNRSKGCRIRCWRRRGVSVISTRCRCRRRRWTTSAGNIVNAVPEEVTFTVDLRANEKQLLASLDDSIVSKCDAAARAQKVQFARERIQQFEAGGRRSWRIGGGIRLCRRRWTCCAIWGCSLCGGMRRRRQGRRMRMWEW